MEPNKQWQDNWKTLLPEDIQRIAQQLETQPLSIANGGIIKRFEKVYAKFAGTEHAIATNNGTAALYSALWAVGVKDGDEVLVCDYGFIGMAGALVTLRAVMVPVDMDPHTLTMDPEDLKRKITPKTKAVLVHNPWGVPARLDAIREATTLPIVLDASHAHGALYRGKPLCAWADIACYSLGMGKLITGGELGCAVTNSIEYRDRMIVLGHTNRSPFDLATGMWEGNNVGLKLRPHVLAMEIALTQLKRFEQKKAKLIDTCQRIEVLCAATGLHPQAVPEGAERVYWRIVLQPGAQWSGWSTADIESLLKEEGLPVENNHYWPLLQHQSPYQWADYKNLVRAEDCPQCRETTPKLITLPAPVDLNDEQLTAIGEAFATVRKRALQTRPA